MDDLTAREVSDWAYECARLDLMSRMPAVPTHRPVLFDAATQAKATKAAIAEAKKAEKAAAKAEKAEEKARKASWERAYKTAQRYAAAQAKKAEKAAKASKK